MSRYVDGFVLPVPKKNLQAYRRIARKAGRVWRDHGALEYLECVGDDFGVKMGVPFPRTVRVKRGETVRAHRDRVNARVMKDPKSIPFDHKRVAYGGFKVLVDA